MKLVPSLLVLAIAAGVVPSAEAGQQARPDPDAVLNEAQAVDSAKPRAIGVCYPIQNDINNTLSPIVSAQDYFYLYDQRRVEGRATITILQNPKHGVLQDEGGGDYSYLPQTGYLGQDTATFLVDIGGQKIKAVYFFHVVNYPLSNSGGEELCGEKGFHWKISSAIDANDQRCLARNNLP